MSTILEQAREVDEGEDDPELSHGDRVLGAFIELGRSMIHVRRAGRHMRLAGTRHWDEAMTNMENEIQGLKTDYKAEHFEFLGEALPTNELRKYANQSRARKADKHHESDNGTRTTSTEAASCGAGSNECGESGRHLECSRD